MGRYADVVGPPSDRDAPADDAPDPDLQRLPGGRGPPPRRASLGRSEPTSTAIGPPSVPPAIATGPASPPLDLDRDGDLDLYLTAAVVGPDGVRDALLINQGDGAFVEAAADWGLPADLASIGVAVADFDADLYPDLYLTARRPEPPPPERGGDDGDAGRRRFVDLTAETGTAGPDALSPMARWLDLDLDGDLDLYVVNHGPRRRSRIGRARGLNVAFRNDGQPVPVEDGDRRSRSPRSPTRGPRPWPSPASGSPSRPGTERAPLLDAEAPHAAVAALDIDSDRDLDLVLAADGRPLRAAAQRPPRPVPRRRPGRPEPPRAGSAACSSLDLDKDGRPDLVSTDSHGRAVAWRNATEGRGETLDLALEPFPIDADGWRSATVADLDLDGWLDLVGTSIVGAELPTWARNEGDRLSARPPADRPPGDGLDAHRRRLSSTSAATRSPTSSTSATAPRRSWRPSRGNGNHWLAIDLGGRWNI